MRTRTYAFGSSSRENHDSTPFYSRKALSGLDLPAAFQALLAKLPSRTRTLSVPSQPVDLWADRIYCHSSEEMHEVPDNSVALVFTSPPYNVGKEYDEDLDLREYFGLLCRVGAEVFRVLKPGGRYVINVANLGRRPYVPMHAFVYLIHTSLGFLPMGEVIWRKGKGANNSCAWGTWCSAKAPRLRDVHEYLLIFAKGQLQRPDDGVTNIDPDEFMKATLSVWDIPPVSAKKVGHPAPFPEDLAARVIQLYSYVDDVVLDPFCGSGTTCVVAKRQGRRYVGYDIEPKYCELAERRLGSGVSNLKLPFNPEA